MSKIKPLDFVRPVPHIKKDLIIVINADGIKCDNTERFVDDSKCIGIVTEVSKNGDCSVSWVGNSPIKCAWWSEKELEVVDNLPNLLSRNMAHPFGVNQMNADDVFPINKENNDIQKAADNFKELRKAVERQLKQINNDNEQN